MKKLTIFFVLIFFSVLSQAQVYIDYKIRTDDFYADTRLEVGGADPTWHFRFQIGSSYNSGNWSGWECLHDQNGASYYNGMWFYQSTDERWSGKCLDNADNIYIGIEGWEDDEDPDCSYNGKDDDYSSDTYDKQNNLSGNGNRNSWANFKNSEGSVDYVNCGAESSDNYYKIEFDVWWNWSIPVDPVFSLTDAGYTYFTINITDYKKYRVTRWNYQVSDDAGFNNIVASSTGVTSTSVLVEGLTKNTLYYVRISGTNEAGTGEWTDDLTISTREDQTITFEALADKTYGDADFGPSATASSGLTVAYASSDTDVATIVSGQIHIVGVGTATITASQAGGGIYYPAEDVEQTLTVVAKELTVVNATASDKVYDGNDDAVISGATLSGVVGSDDVILENSESGTFYQSDVGTGLQVSTSMTISGSDAGNYILTQPVLSANITSKQLTVDGATAVNKVYDGNTDAVITGATLTGVIDTEDVTMVNSTVGTFEQSTVGEGILVTTNMSIGGGDANNYVLAQPTGFAADITAADLTITADNQTKTYDSEAFSDFTVSYDGFVPGDDKTDLAGDLAFSGSAITATLVGSGYEIIPGGLTATNYTISFVNGSLDILPKELIVADASAESKVYDGTTDAVITGGTLDGIVGDEDVTLVNSTAGTFAQSNVGTVISVSTSMTLSGDDAGNYELTQPAGLTADITSAGLTITAENKSKEYDGLVFSDFTVRYDGFISGENETDLEGELTFSGSATTAVNVGSGYVITPGGVTSGNYTISYVDGTLEIIQKPQTITFDALETKVYGDSPFNLTGISSSGLAVSYISSNTNVAIISGNTVYIMGAGSTNITASQEGNSNYSAADDVVQELVVSKADQVLTFYLQISGSITLSEFTDPVQVIAVVNSGLPVTISLGTGSAATLNASNQLENIGETGNVVVNVTQAGNDNYNPASISKSFDVVKANQSITYPAFSNQTYSSGMTVNIGTASANSGLAMTYNLVSGPATLNGSIVTVTGAGEIIVKASQEGNDEWNPAADVTQTLVIDKAAPVITNFADLTKEVDDIPFTLNATSASTGLFTYSSDNSDVATIQGNTVTIVGTGTAELTATQDFDENYASALVSVTLTVLPVVPTVTTATVSSVSASSAVSGGNLTNNGGTESTIKGIVWATTNMPTVESYGGITNDGTGTGSYISSLTGLSPNTTYYVRAYATNSAGTSYGSEVSFTTTIGELTWDGSESNDWHTAANWDGDVVPNENYNVTIPADLTNYPVLLAEGACNNLTIESSATSTGSLTGQEDLTVNGTTTIERYMTGNVWHLVSSPAPGGAISAFLAANTNVPSNGSARGMMDYNESANNWNTFFANDHEGSLTSGKGFSLRTSANGVVTFAGSLATGPVNKTLVRTDNKGWNLIGNPFPSALNANATADANNNLLTVNSAYLDENFVALYLWDEQNGYDGSQDDYVIINHAGGGISGKESLSQDYIQSGQGFLVKAASNNAVFSITTAMQTHQPTVAFKSAEMDWAILVLKVKAGERVTSTSIKFREDMTQGLDIGYDAGAFKNGFDIYTKLVEDNGVDFGLQTLPQSNIESYEIPVGVNVKETCEISFSLNNENFPQDIIPVLNDNQTGEQFAFTGEGDVYTTIVNAESNGYGRFTLTFSSVTGIDDLLLTPQPYRAWYSNGQITISGEIEGDATAEVYDIQGRKLATHRLESTNLNRIEAPQGSSGVYLLKIKNSGRAEVLKVVTTGN